jgi:hypothetical protein
MKRLSLRSTKFSHELNLRKTIVLLGISNNYSKQPFTDIYSQGEPQNTENDTLQIWPALTASLMLHQASLNAQFIEIQLSVQTSVEFSNNIPHGHDWHFTVHRTHISIGFSYQGNWCCQKKLFWTWPANQLLKYVCSKNELAKNIGAGHWQERGLFSHFSCFLLVAT